MTRSVHPAPGKGRWVNVNAISWPILLKNSPRRLRSRKKIDLSDQSTNRSRASVKGKTTPENLARSIINEFQHNTPITGQPIVEAERAFIGPNRRIFDEGCRGFADGILLDMYRIIVPDHLKDNPTALFEILRPDT